METRRDQQNTIYEKRKTVSIKEVCSETGLSRSTVNRAIAEGRLKAIKVGRRVLIPTAAVDAMLGGAA